MTKRQQELFSGLPSKQKYVSDYPDLFAEWHPTKNGRKVPEDFTHGSNKKVWWKCTEGHEWNASIVNRSKGRGCPYCANKLVCSDNNLEVLYPEVAKYWSVKNKVHSSEVLPKSGKRYIWECLNGHSWEDTPHNLVNKKFPCPKCQYAERGDGLRKAKPSFNLATEHPKLCQQWDHKKNEKQPSFYMPKSNDKVWWSCDENHSWKASIDSRTRGNGCPYCGKTHATSEYNLKSLYPELMVEWHPTKNSVEPDQFRPSSNIEVWWKCVKGHEWKAPIYRRTGGSGCSKCSNQSSKNEMRLYTELASIFGDVRHRHKIEGSEADIFLPDFNIAIEYDGKYWHKDKDSDDKKKQSFFHDRGIKLLRVREAPLTQMQPHDLVIPMGSFLTKEILNEVVRFIGSNDAKIQKYLTLKYFIAEETYLKYLEYFPAPFPDKSLAAVNPSLALEWHPSKNGPLKPENFTQSAKPKVWWICEKGHEWQANIYSRNIGGHTCPYCSGRKASSETCMAATHPKLAEMFHPTKNGKITPFNIKAGTGKKLWWQCLENHEHEWQRSGDRMKQPRKSPYCPICAGRKT